MAPDDIIVEDTCPISREPVGELGENGIIFKRRVYHRASLIESIATTFLNTRKFEDPFRNQLYINFEQRQPNLWQETIKTRDKMLFGAYVVINVVLLYPVINNYNQLSVEVQNNPALVMRHMFPTYANAMKGWALAMFPALAYFFVSLVPRILTYQGASVAYRRGLTQAITDYVDNNSQPYEHPNTAPRN